MHLVVFLLVIKAKNLVIRYKSFGNILVLATILAIICYSSIKASTLLNQINLFAPSETQKILNYLIIGISAMPIVLLFFPTYKAKIALFRPYDPLSYSKRAFVEFIYTICSTGSAIISFMLLLIFLLVDNFTVELLVKAFILLITSNILFLLLQIALQKGFNIYLRLIAVFLTISNFATLIKFPGEYYLLVLTFIVAALSYFFYSTVKFFPTTITLGSSNSKGSINALLINIYLKTTTVKVNWILAVAIKLLMTVPFLFKVNSSLPFVAYYQYLLISSIYLFTYVHNNMWGYLKNTYIALCQKKSVPILFRSYLILLAIPLALDIAVTGTLLLLHKTNLLLFLSFYILTLCANILIGFYASLSSPIEVHKSIDLQTFKVNTSLPYSVAAVIFTISLSVAFVQGYGVYVIFPVLLILFYLYYKLLIKNEIQSSIYNIFNKL